MPPQSIIVSDWPINCCSFGKVVSEEKIFLEINQSKTRMACGGHVC
jgi:hypothetical protein